MIARSGSGLSSALGTMLSASSDAPIDATAARVATNLGASADELEAIVAATGGLPRWVAAAAAGSLDREVAAARLQRDRDGADGVAEIPQGQRARPVRGLVDRGAGLHGRPFGARVRLIDLVRVRRGGTL